MQRDVDVAVLGPGPADGVHAATGHGVIAVLMQRYNEGVRIIPKCILGPIALIIVSSVIGAMGADHAYSRDEHRSPQLQFSWPRGAPSHTWRRERHC